MNSDSIPFKFKANQIQSNSIQFKSNSILFKSRSWLFTGFLGKASAKRPWKYTCPGKSICTEASCGSEDAFFRMEASAPRLFGAEQMHFSGEKHLHRSFLWKRRCIFPEESICTEASCGREDAFCQRKVSAQRLLVEEKIHFVEGKYLHRGFLWQRRYILSEESICTEASCGSADVFFQRKASAPRLFGAAQIHFVRGKYLHSSFLE